MASSSPNSTAASQAPDPTAPLEPSSTPGGLFSPTPSAAAETYELTEYDVPPGTHPHDVAVQDDGIVWYTGQNVGLLGRLDPATGEVTEIPLGDGSAPHGVIVGPDGSPWVTDQGLNAVLRVEYSGGPVSRETTSVTTYRMPEGINTGPHTPAFDAAGILWFTGAHGFIGRIDPAIGQVELSEAPRGAGPYGIDATPAGDVWFVSLSQSYLAQVDPATGESTVYEPPTPNQGARRVWSDSLGRLWISEWNAGQLSRYDPATEEWRVWPLPGSSPAAYAVYVDDHDQVWVTDFGSNSILRFDPASETFEPFVLPSASAEVRQLLGRPGEIWGAESGTDKLVVIRRV